MVSVLSSSYGVTKRARSVKVTRGDNRVHKYLDKHSLTIC